MAFLEFISREHSLEESTLARPCEIYEAFLDCVADAAPIAAIEPWAMFCPGERKGSKSIYQKGQCRIQNWGQQSLGQTHRQWTRTVGGSPRPGRPSPSSSACAVVLPTRSKFFTCQRWSPLTPRPDPNIQLCHLPPPPTSKSLPGLPCLAECRAKATSQPPWAIKLRNVIET